MDAAAIRQPDTYKDLLPDGSDETVAKKTASSGLFGIHGGYNHQVQRWVFGVEADVDKPNFNYKIIPPDSTWGTRTETIVQASLRPRAGFALNEHALLYGSAGFTIAKFQNEYSNDFSVPADNDVFNTYQSGWLSSAGIEYQISDRLALRGEARYANFGKFTNHPVKVWSGWLDSHEITQKSIRAGISYQFK